MIQSSIFSLGPITQQLIFRSKWKDNWEAHTLIKSSTKVIKSSTKTIIMALTWGHGWWRGSSSRGQNGRGFHHEACPLAVEHLVKWCGIFLLGGALIWELCCESGFGVNTIQQLSVMDGCNTKYEVVRCCGFEVITMQQQWMMIEYCCVRFCFGVLVITMQQRWMMIIGYCCTGLWTLGDYNARMDTVVWGERVCLPEIHQWVLLIQVVHRVWNIPDWKIFSAEKQSCKYL